MEGMLEKLMVISLLHAALVCTASIHSQPILPVHIASMACHPLLQPSGHNIAVSLYHVLQAIAHAALATWTTQGIMSKFARAEPVCFQFVNVLALCSQQNK